MGGEHLLSCVVGCDAVCDVVCDTLLVFVLKGYLRVTHCYLMVVLKDVGYLYDSGCWVVAQG